MSHAISPGDKDGMMVSQGEWRVGTEGDCTKGSSLCKGPEAGQAKHVIHAFSPSSWEAEACELGFVMRPCLKRIW